MRNAKLGKHIATHRTDLTVALRTGVKGKEAERLYDVAFEYYSALNTPRSLACWILLDQGEIEQLVSLKCKPSMYLEVNIWDLDIGRGPCSARQNRYLLSQFQDDYQATAFLSKYPFSPKESKIDTKAACMVSFRDAERQNARTNEFFRHYHDKTFNGLSLTSVLHTAQRKIGRVLGEFDFDLYGDLMRWGPGATLSTRGSSTSSYHKFGAIPTVTGNALIHGVCAVNSVPCWPSALLETDDPVSILPRVLKVVAGDEVLTVPKNALTDRTIGVPPLLNAYCQASIGRMMRRKMKRYGIDLDDQSRNQDLARRGSLPIRHRQYLAISTLDQKNASNTMAKGLVRNLFEGSDWLDVMEQTRSPSYTLPGETGAHLYEMFSAMGNGFTFELETLIFWAIATSVVELRGFDTEHISVYGDDVIVPNECALDVGWAFQCCGFEVNTTKSYTDGVFRESCGCDYFHGQPVRPYFLKETLSNVETYYRLANGLRRLARRRRNDGTCDKRLRPVWLYCVHGVDRSYRFLIPDGIGDIGFVDTFDVATPFLAPTPRRWSTWEGYAVTGILRETLTSRMQNWDIGKLSHLYDIRMSERDPSMSTSRRETLSVRGRTLPKVKTIFVPEWKDIGGWE